MLHNQADRKSVLWICTYFVLSALSWHYALGPTTVLAVALLSYFSFAGACITHNSMHCRTFCHELNEVLWRHALSLTYGHPVNTFVPGHNLSHHRHTQTSMDPMRTSKLSFKWNLLNGLLFQPTVAADVFKMDVRYLALKKHTGAPYFQRCVNEWLVLGVTQTLLLFLNPYKFFVFLYIPHIFAQWAIVSMNYLQHDGCETDPTKILNGSRNFTGIAINVLTFNNGFHTVHHMHPTLHWSKLPDAHAKLVASQTHPNLNQPCMATYIYRAFIYPGKRVDYMDNPMTRPLPEPDQDWTIHHAPDGVKLEEYDISIAHLVKSLCLLPFKLLCPTYSPAFKID